jgi:hypothetical protein
VHASRLTTADRGGIFSLPTDDFDGLLASKPSGPKDDRSRKEPHVEIAVFVLSLGFIAFASYFAGVDTRELDLVRQPDVQRWSR